jgi:hypothetical protein
MKAIRYDITHTEVPGLVKNFHRDVNFGYAYETDTHFIHFYASSNRWYGIHTGLTVLEAKDGNLLDWVKKYFGAVNIQTMTSDAGVSTEGVWRPGLYYQTHISQALNVSEHERSLNEQALRILIEKLDEIFLYIEPDNISLNTYSHKTRELLILACTEVENFWTDYMLKSNTQPNNGKTYTTKDYVKLFENLFLNEYECSFQSYINISSVRPFENWSASNPTSSLTWYDAYNKTKHNRSKHFSDATFKNALLAVIANIILYIVRYGPFSITERSGTFNSLVNQHFRFNLFNPDLDKIYVPLVNVPDHYRKDIFCYDSKINNDIQPYQVNKLIIY